jgi:hypothetical protein
MGIQNSQINRPSSNTGALSGIKRAEKEKERAALRNKELVHFIKFYALPIFSAVVFFSIIFLTVIPNIRYIFTTLDEIDELRVEERHLNQRIDKLVDLRNQNAQRSELIAQINFLIPTGRSEVVRFRERVANTTEQEQLNLESVRAGETLIDTETATVAAVGDFKLIQIPSEFNMTGEFNNFRNFLLGLYDGDDFFIVDEMQLSYSPGVERSNQFNQVQMSDPFWTGIFNLTKYQFFADENFDADTAFGSISEDEIPNNLVIKFLEDKFISSE